MKQSPSIVPITLAVILVILAGMLHGPLVRMRAVYRLDAAEPLEDAPPLLVFTTVALGGFRGLLADMLWLRVTYLQDEGKYVELVQLSDWITKLEPHCTEIWGFHAWNMAYNVSIMMPDYEDRWRWVRNGIQLLRDEGIQYNRGDPRLYWELGWMFQHKIGAVSDNAHVYYKKRWAEEMTALLGGGHPDYDALASDPERRKRLEQEYKLLLSTMREVDARYGPLDWRRPEAHAIYWAYRGSRYTKGSGAKLCKEMIEQSLRALSQKASPTQQNGAADEERP
jgi:hypothetical protein